LKRVQPPAPVVQNINQTLMDAKGYHAQAMGQAEYSDHKHIPGFSIEVSLLSLVQQGMHSRPFAATTAVFAGPTSALFALAQVDLADLHVTSCRMPDRAISPILDVWLTGGASSIAWACEGSPRARYVVWVAGTTTCRAFLAMKMEELYNSLKNPVHACERK